MLGWTLVILGIIGLFVPFLQGFVFLALGLSILSYHSIFIHQKLINLRERFPALAERCDRARKRFADRFRR